MSVETYEQALEFLFSQPRGGTVFSASLAENEKRFAQRKRFFNWLLQHLMATRCANDNTFKLENITIIHVAGTKGKGSTCAMLDKCLRLAGKKTGIFTSPHLHTLRERIRVDGELIPKDRVVELTKELHQLDQLSAAAGDAGSEDGDSFVPFPDFCNFFDRLFALAMAHFIEQRVDAIVLETGLGGRFDTTNVFDYVSACILTSISLDHQKILGNTIPEIAWQKAGILKNGVPCFSSNIQADEVQTVFETEATKVGAWMSFIDLQEIRGLITSGKLTLSLQPGTLQMENASLVLAVLKKLFASTPDVLEKAMAGFSSTHWPARYEQLTLKSGHLAIIDGAHNEDSFHKLLDALDRKQTGKEVWLVFGTGSENYEALLQLAFKRATKVALVHSPHFKAIQRSVLVDCVNTHLVSFKSKLLDVGDDSGLIGPALSHILNTAKPATTNSVILFAGSLFAAAEARVALETSGAFVFPDSDWVKQREPPVANYK